MQTSMHCLALLVLALGYSTSYTMEVTRKIVSVETVHTSSFASVHETEEHDDLGTAIVVYGAITSIYAIYWLRQKQ